MAADEAAATSSIHSWRPKTLSGSKAGLKSMKLTSQSNCRYKMSNILDKPTESVFGYISVLPGAFSAYRYKALLNTANGQGPLASYFLGEKMHEPGAHAASVFDSYVDATPYFGESFFTSLIYSNMYLAEDRILCFEIVTKKREAWVLRYVKSAKASTDVPTTVCLCSHPHWFEVPEAVAPLGRRPHWPTPAMAEWFVLCRCTRDHHVLPSLDVWTC